MRTLLLSAILGAALAESVAGSAAAQRLRVRVGADAPFSECYCRAKGNRIEVGQTACLSSPDGPRQATCAMSQNVTTWRFSERPCPES
jgi:uncharacterized membrane protein